MNRKPTKEKICEKMGGRFEIAGIDCSLGKHPFRSTGSRYHSLTRLTKEKNGSMLRDGESVNPFVSLHSSTTGKRESSNTSTTDPEINKAVPKRPARIKSKFYLVFHIEKHIYRNIRHQVLTYDRQIVEVV